MNLGQGEIVAGAGLVCVAGFALGVMVALPSTHSAEDAGVGPTIALAKTSMPDAVASTGAGFRVSESGVLVLDGVITPDLKQRLATLPENAYRLVVLDSIGGDVAAAIAIGKIFRSRRVETHIPRAARCYSACTVLFQAGVRRTAHPDAELLYHYAVQASDDPNHAVRGSVWGTVRLMEALIEFDADPAIYDHLPGIGDWVLSPRQAREFNIVQVVTPGATLH